MRCDLPLALRTLRIFLPQVKQAVALRTFLALTKKNTCVTCVAVDAYNFTQEPCVACVTYVACEMETRLDVVFRRTDCPSDSPRFPGVRRWVRLTVRRTLGRTVRQTVRRSTCGRVNKITCALT